MFRLQTTTWTCSRCQELQRCLSRYPPRRPVCLGCREKERRPWRLYKRLVETGIPARFRQGEGREDWQRRFQRRWPESLEGWASSYKLLNFWGPAGTGKTGLATILLTEHLEAGGDGFWIRAPKIGEIIKCGMVRGDPQGEESLRRVLEARSLMDRLSSTPLLVLDDLFAGRATAYVRDLMLYIIADRFDALKPTVITTMLSPSRLLELEPSLTSRLAAGLVLGLQGPDRRLEGKF